MLLVPCKNPSLLLKSLLATRSKYPYIYEESQNKDNKYNYGICANFQILIVSCRDSMFFLTIILVITLFEIQII